VREQLPPGPRTPMPLQSIGWWSRPTSFMERARARYGKRFTTRIFGGPPFVVHSEPEQVREIFTAPPDVLHPGEGARVLEPVVGSKSVILLDERAHLEQRKLMLPAFHGERMEALTGLLEAVVDQEIERWPTGEPIALHPRLQAVTLEVILRAVFGLEPGPRLDTLRRNLTELLEFGTKPISMVPQLQPLLSRFGPGKRFTQVKAETDRLLFELVDERRAAGDAEGEDVLTMLLGARHEDGSPMTEEELRDELMTLLVAGHETTASQLAWTFERLAREPRVVARLREEIATDDDEPYLVATIQESMRRRPVLPNAAPRLTMRPVEIGGWQFPAGVALVVNTYLLHHDPDVYEDPYAFRPERFLDSPPGTYTWTPFGGGRRRCLGASFATLEMRIVLRAVLRRGALEPAGGGPEMPRRRAITISPRGGARVRIPAPARETVAA
jgi:cytochrome P450